MVNLSHIIYTSIATQFVPKSDCTSLLNAALRGQLWQRFVSWIEFAIAKT